MNGTKAGTVPDGSYSCNVTEWQRCSLPMKSKSSSLLYRPEDAMIKGGFMGRFAQPEYFIWTWLMMADNNRCQLVCVAIRRAPFHFHF
jgi:hypothetical protein